MFRKVQQFTMFLVSIIRVKNNIIKIKNVNTNKGENIENN